MKNFKHLVLLTITTMVIVAMASAQQETFIENDTAANGTIKFRKYDVSVNPQPVAKEKELLQSVLGITSNDSLSLVATTKDAIGFTHKFFLQYYKGIKVEYANYVTHSRNGNIEIINGEYAKVGNPVVVPAISETDALSYALKYVNAQLYKWQIPAEENDLKKSKNNAKATYYPKGERLSPFFS